MELSRVTIDTQTEFKILSNISFIIIVAVNKDKG